MPAACVRSCLLGLQQASASGCAATGRLAAALEAQVMACAVLLPLHQQAEAAQPSAFCGGNTAGDGAEPASAAEASGGQAAGSEPEAGPPAAREEEDAGQAGGDRGGAAIARAKPPSPAVALVSGCMQERGWKGGGGGSGGLAEQPGLQRRDGLQREAQSLQPLGNTVLLRHATPQPGTAGEQ